MKHAISIAALSLMAAAHFLPSSAFAAPDFPKFSIHVETSRIDDAVMQRVHEGQTRREITSLIGAPDSTVKFPLSHTVAWDYNYRDIWGYDAVFSVIFDEEGTVQSKFNGRAHY